MLAKAVMSIIKSACDLVRVIIYLGISIVVRLAQGKFENTMPPIRFVI